MQGTKLYPDDLKIRAKVDQRLCFNSGFWNKYFFNLIFPKVYKGEDFSKEVIGKIEQDLEWINDFLKDTGFLAGTDGPTLADYSLLAMYSSMNGLEGVVPIDLSKYNEINDWFDKMKKLTKNYDESNGNGAKGFADYVRSKM